MPYKNKEDRAQQWKRWRENNRERSREIQVEYRKRNKEQINEKQKINKSNNKEREQANWKFRFAVKRGWIIRPEGKHFHHPDYSRPYYGAWVTPLEHMQIHAKMIDCPECVDYQQEVMMQKEASVKAGRSKGGINACISRWSKTSITAILNGESEGA